jgi:hypothetical protein
MVTAERRGLYASATVAAPRRARRAPPRPASSGAMLAGGSAAGDRCSEPGQIGGVLTHRAMSASGNYLTAIFLPTAWPAVVGGAVPKEEAPVRVHARCGYRARSGGLARHPPQTGHCQAADAEERNSLSRLWRYNHLPRRLKPHYPPYLRCPTGMRSESALQGNPIHTLALGRAGTTEPQSDPPSRTMYLKLFMPPPPKPNRFSAPI